MLYLSSVGQRMQHLGDSRGQWSALQWFRVSADCWSRLHLIGQPVRTVKGGTGEVTVQCAICSSPNLFVIVWSRRCWPFLLLFPTPKCRRPVLPCKFHLSLVLTRYLQLAVYWKLCELCVTRTPTVVVSGMLFCRMRQIVIIVTSMLRVLLGRWSSFLQYNGLVTALSIRRRGIRGVSLSVLFFFVQRSWKVTNRFGSSERFFL